VICVIEVLRCSSANSTYFTSPDGKVYPWYEGFLSHVANHRGASYPATRNGTTNSFPLFGSAGAPSVGVGGYFSGTKTQRNSPGGYYGGLDPTVGISTNVHGIQGRTYPSGGTFPTGGGPPGSITILCIQVMAFEEAEVQDRHMEVVAHQEVEAHPDSQEVRWLWHSRRDNWNPVTPLDNACNPG
jgi:hypothetical protein